MARKTYQEDEVLKSLRKKKDCKIDPQMKIIRCLNNDAKTKYHDLGNGSWGKIDFLVKKCGYKQFDTSSF